MCRHLLRPLPTASLRRGAMALLALGLLATSCGNDDDGGDATDQGAPETRVVDTVLGEVKIPADPQNVVVDWVTFDNLAVLEHDMDTIGDVFELSFFLENPEFSPERTELAEELGLTGAVGATYELNAEALAALDPDLIVVAEDQAPEADVLDTMAEIAPVVVYDLPDGSKSFAQWEDGLEGLAQVLGGDAPERAADAIAGFEAELERVRDDHADVVDDVTVSIGTVSPDYIGLSMEGRNIGTEVATALGLARPDAQLELEVDEFNTIELSPERLTVLDADLIFLEQRVDEVGALEANPLFQGLRAVQAGNVSFVPNYWEFGGAGAALLVLADIDEALTTFAGA